MKSTRFLLGSVGLSMCITVALSPAPARAGERGSRDGKYDETRTSGGRETVKHDSWAGRDELDRNGHELNPRGDANGDLLPTIKENSVAPHYPWVIWSRSNGINFDLAWSRWAGADWTPIRWVETERSAGDDLDPAVAFDMIGTPYVSWWRDVDGVGEIYISVFIHGHWWHSLRVSQPRIDARTPKISVYGLGYIVVEYETPLGTMFQEARFHRPVTITDDINPLSVLHLVGEPVIVDRAGHKTKD